PLSSDAPLLEREMPEEGDAPAPLPRGARLLLIEERALPGQFVDLALSVPEPGAAPRYHAVAGGFEERRRCLAEWPEGAVAGGVLGNRHDVTDAAPGEGGIHLPHRSRIRFRLEGADLGGGAAGNVAELCFGSAIIRR